MTCKLIKLAVEISQETALIIFIFTPARGRWHRIVGTFVYVFLQSNAAFHYTAFCHIETVLVNFSTWNCITRCSINYVIERSNCSVVCTSTTISSAVTVFNVLLRACKNVWANAGLSLPLQCDSALWFFYKCFTSFSQHPLFSFYAAAWTTQFNLLFHIYVALRLGSHLPILQIIVLCGVMCF